MTVVHEGPLAWRLADQYRGLLRDDERTMLFVELGIGDYHAAIDRVLRCLARRRASLSRELLVRLLDWPRTYDRGEYRQLLAQVSPQTAVLAQTSLRNARELPSPTATSAHQRRRSTTAGQGVDMTPWPDFLCSGR